VPKGLRKRMGWGCYTCGSYLYFGYGGPDENGERVDYCIDCWPGYECCGFVGCNHYQCEHAEDMCGNAGCPCTGFITKNQADAHISNLGHACRAAYWALEEMEGIKEVRSEVEMVVRVTTVQSAGSTVENSKAWRETIYAVQSKLMREHPDVLFDFILL